MIIVLPEFLNGISDGVLARFIDNACISMSAGVLTKVGPRRGVNEDGATCGEVFDKFCRITGEGSFLGFMKEWQNRDKDVGAGL